MPYPALFVNPIKVDRPPKAFQAWSAASFIRACQEVGLEPGRTDHE